MSQDTRKDPRAKAPTMTVRYKSATVDEFIEHHAYDVSRGGIFIRAPAPLAAGTLLKFELKIKDDQPVMSGVGRVVWNREPGQTGADTPTGMGVKFIKLDDGSRSMIDRLIEAQTKGGLSTFEAGRPSALPSEPAAPISLSSKTMLGIGDTFHETPEMSRPTNPDKPQKRIDTPPQPFFPVGLPAAEPPPEDRTVMKQAAELLRQALTEAGGSMEGIESSRPGAPKAPLSDEPIAAPVAISSAPAAAASSLTEADRAADAAAAAQLARASSASAPPPAVASTPPVRSVPSTPPASVAPPEAPATSGRLLLFVAIGVGTMAIAYALMSEPPAPAAAPPPPPAPPTAVAPAPQPAALETAPAAAPTPVPSAAISSASAIAEPAPSASAPTPSVSVSAKLVPTAAPKVEAKPAPPLPKPKAAIPAPAPKPVAKPVAKPAPKPAPKPKAKKPSDDPYE